jgi:hypothetical protein
MVPSEPPIGTIDAVDYLLGATRYQASIKPPLGTINVVDYLLGATLYQASIKPPLGTINAVDYLLGVTQLDRGLLLANNLLHQWFLVVV